MENAVFAAGRLQGQVTITYSPDGSTFRGELQGGVRAGEVTLDDGAAFRYAGAWARDAPHGRGDLRPGQNRAATGTFADGTLQQCTVDFDGRRYEGSLLDVNLTNSAFR